MACVSATHKEDRYLLHDARGIPCGYVCPACEDEVRSRYRIDVMTDSNYVADEDIEEDRW